MKPFSLFSILLSFCLISNISFAEQIATTNLTPKTTDQMSQTIDSQDKKIHQININTASAEEIAKSLNGIGTNKAKRIIEYREKFGPFVSLEQLKEVPGIGKATLDKNIEKITL